MEAKDVQQAVQEKYAELARSVRAGGGSCCGPSCCSPEDPITGNLYGGDQTALLPKEAVDASLGCGNPTALIELKEGQVVLDLGSGGGIDVLLSARRVGPSGKVYGLDMTDEMLALARDNQRKAAITNVEFLKGDIEAIPLPDDSVDVVISNCVINLAPDKTKVLAEAFVDVADAHLTRREQAEDSEPGRIGKCLKGVFERGQPGVGSGHYMPLDKYTPTRILWTVYSY